MECTLWYRGEELVKDWNFLIFPRQGYTDPWTLNLPKNFEVAEFNSPEVSSTEVRELIKAGEPFEHLLMPKAAEYLKQNSLYGYEQYL